MIYILIFTLAIFATSYFPVLPDPLYLSTYACLLIISLGIWLAAYTRHYKIVAVCVGLVVGCAHGVRIVDQQLPPAYEGKAIVISAVIEGLPQQNDHKQRFLVTVRGVVSQQYQALIGQKLQLSRYLKSYDDRRLSPASRLIPGQEWQFTVKLRRPRGLVNPSGFDYHAYLLRNNIYATGYIRDPQSSVLLRESCWLSSIDCVRWHIQERFKRMSSSVNTLGPLIALTIGDTQWMSVEQWDVFKNTGTVHLLAISGLHIGLSAAIGLWLGRLLMRLVAVVLPMQWFTIVIPALCSIAAALSYSLLAGMSLPTKRALVMVVIYHVARLFLWRISPVFILLGALCFIALSDPLAVFSQGFWLSFVAVTVLLYGFSGRNVTRHASSANYIYSAINAQWILLVGLLLPNLLWLQGLSVSAPIANIVAIAWVSIVIVPLLFIVLLALLLPVSEISIFATWIYTLLESAMALLLTVLSYFNQVITPFWYSSIGKPGSVVMVLCVIASLYLLLPKGIGWRHIALLYFLPLIYPIVHTPHLQMTVMDVGQGTAIVVQTKNHQLVYDTGRMFSEKFNVGEHILTPYLRDQRISRLDKLIVSHRDGDHAGGVSGLLKSTGVDHILLGQALPAKLGDTAMVEPCVAGQKWQWDEVVFTVLWPKKPLYSVNTRNNNRSCVLLIAYNDQRILLTGDIEKRIESALLDHPLLSDGVDIMLVPHHGSVSSSGVPWVKHLNPRWAVVSAGYRNQYRHPHPSVKARYDEIGSQWMNTANLGAMQWSIYEKGDWHVTSWRLDNARYWY